ncbi:MAG: imidazoleglycerol-phosphate dehydratase HisB [Balneolaceae bacterium]
MIIDFDIKTLANINSNFLFRQGSIAALQKIQDSGHSFTISGGALSSEQLNILNQEDLTPSDDSSKTDFKVQLDGEELTLLKDDETRFSTSSIRELAEYLSKNARTASLKRTTNETDISISLNLDGSGKANINTGLKFFDHMLDQIARHGLVDLELTCNGDLDIDEHHTIEDVAIALGETITKALGDKKGIDRYGFVLPMDEAQATVAMDLSGRPYLVYDVPLSREYVGDFPTDMLEHFFYSLAMNLKATLHISCYGNNDHHKVEACFKGFARTLKAAVEQNDRIKNQIPSSKGTL